ncbi:MAG: hypothetical protein PWR20_2558 [Bacteroidales bacterium]|jgi:hypothetical protein|nr:hypothetical protein [Bacteroidales bacterium]NLH53000.1 hypothetical protein [Bacteroidales bacterium]
MTAQSIFGTKKGIESPGLIQHKVGVSLVFDRDEQLIGCVKTPLEVAWSRSRNLWHRKSPKFRLDKVFEAFRGRDELEIFVAGTHKIETDLPKSAGRLNLKNVEVTPQVPYAYDSKFKESQIQTSTCFRQNF